MGLRMESLAARSIEPLAEIYGASELERVAQAVRRLQGCLQGHTIWNVNSTARGGGVAELLRSLVAYARGVGVDCRWAVIAGEPEFFRLTKRLHNAMHGAGAGVAFGERERELYQHTARENAAELLALIKPGDVAILHDPQTLGLAPLLAAQGVRTIWRCHIGSETSNDNTRAALAFLAPYLEHVGCHVFSREAFIPRGLSLGCVRVIAPSIDPLSPKNQALTESTRHAILVQAGLLDGSAPDGAEPVYRMEDGSLGRVTRSADIMRLGRACCADEPLVVQISRWDRLKDHLGVLGGFARFVSAGGNARLILAGPNVKAVVDDPEGAEVFDEVLHAYRELPHGVRRMVELANLPMADAQENAAIVNALQRQATVLVQKSLQEGFGLTVTEAMWKGKAVIASRVGGIQDQIEHGKSGLLLDDPSDTAGFAELLGQVLSDRELAQRLGRGARERVRERYLSLRSLYAFTDLICDQVESCQVGR